MPYTRGAQPRGVACVWVRASLFLVHLGQRSAQRGTLGRSHPGYIGHFRSTACLALALALARTYAESREL